MATQSAAEHAPEPGALDHGAGVPSALPNGAESSPSAAAWQRWWLDLLIVAGLLALALAVRFYQLDQYPPGLYNDEAAYASDAVGVLEGRHAVFFPRNHGREPIFIYLLAAAFQLFGATPFVLRATAALVGALTIPATYWLTVALARYEFPNRPTLARWAALWVGLLVTFSYWHISFSRLGFRAITLPLFLALAFAVVWRLLRRLRDEPGLPWSDAIFAGVLLGACAYTYTAGRMAAILFGALAIAALIGAQRAGLERRRVFQAAAVVTVVTTLVVAPLGIYFLQHPGDFASRAASVSIFSPLFAPEGPLAAFGSGLAKTVLNFGFLADENLRHNPAQRPVVEPLLGLWLAAGVVLSLVFWRRLTSQFTVLWMFLFLAPSLLSAEGVPHSLRTIGLIPLIHILPVAAMLYAGYRLLPRGRLFLLLPLPFVVFSSVAGVRDYFGAWTDPLRFRSAFLTDYVRLAEAIADAGGTWILALSPNYGQPGSFDTISFMVGDAADYHTVLMTEEAAAKALTDFARTEPTLNVLHPYDWPELSETSFAFLDAKGLLDFLLRRNGRVLRTRDEQQMSGVPYTTYEVDPDSDFLVGEEYGPVDGLFGGRVRLVGAMVGSGNTRLEAPGAKMPADQPLWSVLRWEALEPIDIDLKTSLRLLTPDGRLAGQTDFLLTGDRYPVERVWEAGELSTTYHIVDMLPAVPPGDYRLMLSVYEDETGQIYPAVGADGNEVRSMELGVVHVAPPTELPSIAPPQPADAPALGNLALSGYEIMSTVVAPGDSALLTLYWQAGDDPEGDMVRTVRLLDQRGGTVTEVVRSLDSAAYPSRDWRPGETVLDWAELRLPPETPMGDYALEVELQSSDGARSQAPLQVISVQGRAHRFEPPMVATPVEATFGYAVRLLGIAEGGAAPAGAGETWSATLVWQTLATSPPGMVRFAHLLDSGGALVAQQDTVPCDTACPSESWIEGEYLEDGVAMALPLDLGPGVYSLAIGWYFMENGQRLPARRSDGQPLPNDVVVVPAAVSVE